MLRTVREMGIVSGRDLRARTLISYRDLVDLVQTLLEHRLIDVEGDATNEKRIPRAHFRFLPSSENDISKVLKKF